MNDRKPSSCDAGIPMIDRKIDDGSGSHHSRYASTSPRSMNPSMSSPARCARGFEQRHLLRREHRDRGSCATSCARRRRARAESRRDGHSSRSARPPRLRAAPCWSRTGGRRANGSAPGCRPSCGATTMPGAIASMPSCSFSVWRPWGWSLVSAANSSAPPPRAVGGRDRFVGHRAGSTSRPRTAPRGARPCVVRSAPQPRGNHGHGAVSLRRQAGARGRWRHRNGRGGVEARHRARRRGVRRRREAGRLSRCQGDVDGSPRRSRRSTLRSPRSAHRSTRSSRARECRARRSHPST